MLKRTLSLVLAFVMVFSLLPLNALAEETAPDEGENLLLEPAETAEAEPETTSPPQTQEETTAETEAQTVPTTVETQPAEEETAPATEETVPETEEVTLPEETESPVPESADLAGLDTWTLDEQKRLTLTPTPNNEPCISFVFTVPSGGDYILWWNEEEIRGFDPHVSFWNLTENHECGGGNVYASLYNAKPGEQYRIDIQPCSDRQYTAAFTLSQIMPLNTISFWDQEVTGYPGQRIWNRLSREPKNALLGSIEWTSSDESVAIVSDPQFSASEITLVGPGTATITAKSDKGPTAFYTVNVKGNDGEWELNETKTLELQPGPYDVPSCTYTFTAPEDGDYILWWDPSEAHGNGPHVTVRNSSGYQVTSGNVGAPFHDAKKGETYTISVYTLWDQPYTANITLSHIAPLRSISLNRKEITGFVGEVVHNRLVASPLNAEFGTITWFSSNSQIAEVTDPQTAGCIVQLKAPGTATITAKSDKGITAKFTIRVQAPSDTWTVGQTKSLTLSPTANGAPCSAFTFTAPEEEHYIVHWRDPEAHDGHTYVKVQSADGNGYSSGNLYANIRAAKDQKFLITVYTESDTPYTIDLTLDKVVPQEGIRFSSPFCIGEPEDMLSCIVLRDPGNSVYSEETSWQVENPEIAVIREHHSYGALLEMQKPGITTVTATTKEGKTASMQVICAEPMEAGDDNYVPLYPGEETAFCFVAPRNGTYLFRASNTCPFTFRLVGTDGTEETSTDFIRFSAKAGEAYTLFVSNDTEFYDYCRLYLNSASALKNLNLSWCGDNLEEFTVGLGINPILTAVFDPVTAADTVEWAIQNGSGSAELVKLSETQVEIISLTPGTVTLTASCQGKTASCKITFINNDWDPIPITPGTTRDISLEARDSVWCTLTVPESGTYVLWDANHHILDYNLYDEEDEGGGLLLSSCGNRLVFEAIASKSYGLAITNYSEENLLLELHLEKPAPAERMTIANGLDTLYLYPEDYVQLDLTMEPMNALHGELNWYVEGGNEEIVNLYVPDKEDDETLPAYCKLQIIEPGKYTLHVTDGTLEAHLPVVVKAPEELTAGVVKTLTSTGGSTFQRNTYYAYDTGDYILLAKAEDGKRVSLEITHQGDDIPLFQQADTAIESMLRLDGGDSYKFDTRLLDENGNPASGSYTLCLIPVSGAFPLTSAHITLPQNTQTQLISEYAKILCDRIEFTSSDKGILAIVDGQAIGKTPGTAFVTASLEAAGRTFRARCRVDVADDRSIADVLLSTTAPTVELYRSDCTTITILPRDEDGKAVSAEAPVVCFEPSDKLSDEDFTVLNQLFNLEMADSRTLRIAPDREETDKIFYTEYDALSVKGSYTVNLSIRYPDIDPIVVPIKLSIKKTTPKLTAAKINFDAFIYPYAPQPIVLTGGTATAFVSDDEMPNPILWDWIGLEGNCLSLYRFDDVSQKASGNVYLLAYTEEWTVPGKVRVPVSVSYNAPSLKLSASTINIPNADSDDIEPLELQILPGKKGQTLEELQVSDLYCSENDFGISGFNPHTGTFNLHIWNQITAPRTITLTVEMDHTYKSVPLKLKVIPKEVTLHAQSTSVKLNTQRDDSVRIPLTSSPAGYYIDDDSIDIEVVGGKEDDFNDPFYIRYLDPRYGDNALWIYSRDDTPPGNTYKLILNAKGSTKKTTITISTIGGEVTASAKLLGTLDLTYPDEDVILQPTFKNYSGAEAKLTGMTISDKDGKNVTPYFERMYSEEERQYCLRITDPEGKLAPGTYYLTPTYDCRPDKVTPVKFTVKRSPVSLKLSQTKLTLNKAIQDWATVDLTCLTQDYALDQPIITVTAGKGVSPDGLDTKYSNGVLRIAVNDSTVPGATYTVSIKARDFDKAVSVKVTAAAGKKATAALKVKGTIDLARISTGVVILPTYKNCSGQGGPAPKLTIRRYSAGDTKYTGSFEIAEEFTATSNNDGTFTVTRTPGKTADLSSYRYLAVLSFGSENCIDASVALPVKSNAVKATVSGVPVLYKADGYSRGTFRLSIADTTVNPIVKVTSASDLYEIHDYGNGEYAIGFKDHAVSATAKYPTSVKLNLYLEGSDTPAATVTLKLNLK